MKLYALIGKTGTGKSYNASIVAHKYDIKYFIDDAILIKENSIIAGKSAKTERTKISSVKKAIFMDEDRQEEMKRVLKKEKPDKLLILGTSDSMVDTIAQNLDLEKIDEKIYIEDIVSKESIEIARKSRLEEGKHIVPVPTFEIKSQFSGYFLDPVRIFNVFLKDDDKTMEKSIIRPTYSLIGNYYIAEKVVNSIITHVTSKINGVAKVLKVLTNKQGEGTKIVIDISVIYGNSIPKISDEIRKTVGIAIEKTTGIYVLTLNINVKDIERINTYGDNENK